MVLDTTDRIARAIEGLCAALKFYADDRRYYGPNQQAPAVDNYAPDADCPYLWDVTRDHGAIARKALADYGTK